MRALLALAASLALALALAACGGTHPDKPTTGGDGSGSGTGSGSATETGTGTGTGSGTGTALSQDDCRTMFGHIIDISLAERHAKNPTEPPFKPEVIADLKDKQAAAGMDQCLKMPRDQYDCLMTATDSSSLGLCGE